VPCRILARRAWRTPLLTSIALLLVLSGSARAADRLCDPGAEDCRTILINYIRAERVGIDVAFWFMEDARYTTELAIKWREGVPVRVLIDTKANSRYPLNAQRIAELQAAGIPIRRINSSSRYLHWKMMLFDGQNVVQFSGANYSPSAWTPGSATPYADYVDESIYFSDNGAIVNSFRTKFDDAWVSTSGWTNHANITAPLARSYDVFAKHPDLNFPPSESYRSRAVARYNAETRGIDAIMYRITDRAHADAMIAAVKRGVPVRLITEPKTYRDKDHIWHAWNVDRMYMNGVQIKQRAHAGLNHQKSVLLTNQRMVIFGSSNWTTASDVGQYEHNMFTTQPDLYAWFFDQFERKWFNAGGTVENVDFVPLAPGTPSLPAPGDLATGVGTSVTLRWWGGSWAHVYDVYVGTSPDPPLIAANLALGPSESLTDFQTYRLPSSLAGGTTYYWRIVGKTAANASKSSLVWSFTTAGAPGVPAPGPAPIPPPPPQPGPAPAPAPRAPSSGGCTTPDPFVALGGGRCHQGGWLPPGMPIPGAPAPAPAPPPPPSPAGCATPDPFVALGGGTCFQGGWFPPGMTIPGTPALPRAPAPAPAPRPSTTISCTTPDPFVALGGGRCYQGGWLPPGMPIPGQPPPTPAPATAPAGCTTPDPFVALGGGRCYLGGWFPPGMPLPRG
jgi:hypothetical protein